MPTISPIGVPISVPTPVWISVPTMALSSPPFDPGGFVMLVNTPSDKPAPPSQSSVNRIDASSSRPIAVASNAQHFDEYVGAMPPAAERLSDPLILCRAWNGAGRRGARAHAHAFNLGRSR